MKEQETVGTAACRCYSTVCQRKALHRCHYYARCLHAGCDEHMPKFKTREGVLRLYGACRLLRAIAYQEDHLIGLRTREGGE